MSNEILKNYTTNCFAVPAEYKDHDKEFLENGIIHKETFRQKRIVCDKRIPNLRIIDCICDGVPVKWYTVDLDMKKSSKEMLRSSLQLALIVLQDFEDRIAEIKSINKAFSIKEKFFISMMRMSGKGFGKVSQGKEKYILYIQLVIE